MKTLPAPKFLVYAVLKAIRHPLTPISYYFCSKCNVRFPASSSACPKCADKVGKSPENKKESPIPWWGAVLCIIIGIGTWVTSACLKVPGLDEASRILVYVPLGSLFGMSLQR